MPDTTDPSKTAEQLRARARDLYHRSDNVPLGRSEDRAAIERVGDLREEADRLMARADDLEAMPDATDPGRERCVRPGMWLIGDYTVERDRQGGRRFWLITGPGQTYKTVWSLREAREWIKTGAGAFRASHDGEADDA